MSHLRPATGPRSPAVDRRGLLAAGAGLAGTLGLSALTGCSPSDPRVDSPGQTLSPRQSHAPTAGPSPEPSASHGFPDVAWASNAEQALAQLAAAIVAGPHRAELTGDRRRVLAAVAAAHQQHVVALNSAEPTTRPVTPTAAGSSSPKPSSTPTHRPTAGVAGLTLAQSLALLVTNERAQARRLRQAAVRASGLEALLWGSMSVAATTFGAAAGSKVAVPSSTKRRAHQPMTAVTDVEAVQSMVRQLQAIVYGYQVALGHLDESGAAGRRALASLQSHRLLRDRLVRSLIARSASVPAAAGAYVPSVNPTTAGRAARLIRRMETALEPFCGLWLASATDTADRTLALDTLSATVATARGWNAPLTVWPGWQG